MRKNVYIPKLDSMEERNAPGNLFDLLNALPLSLPEPAFADLLAPAEPGSGGRIAGQPTVSGYAYGIYSDLEIIGLIRLDIPPTPYVELPPEGGEQFEQALSLDLNGLLTVGVLTAYTVGEVNEEEGFAYAISVADAAEVTLLDLITLQVVTAVSTSWAGDGFAGSTSEGSSLLGTIGLIDIKVTPEPNTEIKLLGIRIVLNEQFLETDGMCTSALTVNMVHIYGDGTLLDGELVIASAHSDVNFC